MRIFLLFGFAFLARLYLASLGYNYDLQSFQIVADLCHEDLSPYAHTTRYNYGPIWAYTLSFLRSVQHILFVEPSIDNFHYVVAAYIGLGDVFLALALHRKPTNAPLYLILVSPLSMLISGYHSAFDNWAILWGVLAFQALQNRQIYLSALLVGLSLATKHILIFFPLWLLWSPLLSARQKLHFLGISYGIFGLLFAPFLLDAAGRAGIWANVLNYRSAEGIALLPYLSSKLVYIELYKQIAPFFTYLFFGLAIGAGYYFRRRQNDIFYLYLLVFFGASSALATQYLIIPLIGLIGLRKYGLFWVFSSWAALFLLLRSPTNLGGLPFWADLYANIAHPRLFFDALLSLYTLQGLVIWALLLYSRFQLDESQPNNV